MRRGKLSDCLNIWDLRDAAQSALPSPILAYLEGGTDDEYSLRRNCDAFADYELIPKFLVDVSDVEMSTRVLGTQMDFPVLLSPTGMSRLFHPDAELAVARAAAKHGTLYCLSTVATESIESVAAAAAGPKMFQIYVLKDQGLNTEFIDRARAANYQALCLTVDVTTGSNRERDLRLGMTMPPRFPWRSRLSFLTHPAWTLARMTGPSFDLPNISHRMDKQLPNITERLGYIFQQFDPSVSWADAEAMIAQWNGPFAIKGILSPADAKQAVAIGASAIIVSNHGGRQLDTVPAPIDCLQSIADAVGDEAEVILDGGIRRGTDVLKAMAMGAKACMIGRPYLYGLAAAGEAGVDHALKILKDEVKRDLALIGCQSPNDLDLSFIRGK